MKFLFLSKGQHFRSHQSRKARENYEIQSQLTTNEQKLVNLDRERNMLYQILDKVTMVKIKGCKNVKEISNTLVVIYDRTELIKNLITSS